MKEKEMKKHRFNIFPEMQPDDYSRLKNDIAKNGYDSTMPIMLYQGDIIDGWNRFKACRELSIEPNTADYNGSDADAIEYIMRTNKRRNLNSSQWACIAAEADEMLKAIGEAVEAAAKIKMADAKLGNENASKEKQQCQLIDRVETIRPEPRQPERVTQKAAEMFNTNRTYISEAIKLKEERPEVFEQIKNGEKTITEVKKEQKEEKKRQERDKKNAEIIKIIESGALEHVSEFEIVLADPPWRYDFSETECRKIENNYPTATIEDICKHAPKTTENAILFLWATAPKLREAMQVVDAWGFEYKTHAIWDKCKIGMGYWFRGQHELLIVATKGNASPPIAENRVSSIFKEPRGEHSKKPDCVYEWIESAFVSYKKLEMYARSNRPGWHSWGAEA
jgi:N6-adenosine-specific RNA methylase IME4